MVQDGPISQAHLKRELEELSRQIFKIDLKIQSFRQQRNNTYIPALKAVKVELQKQIG